MRMMMSKGRLSVLLVFALVLVSTRCAALCAIETCSGSGTASTPSPADDPPCERAGGLVSALVDLPLERDCEVTVFLPENAYVAEVRNCVAHGKQFTIELVLIQYQDN